VHCAEGAAQKKKIIKKDLLRKKVSILNPIKQTT
jgi:hypothetical protein